MRITSFIISLIFAFQTQVMAQDFICKSVYKERMEKLEKSYKLRKYSTIAGVALILVGGMATAPIGSTALLLGGAIAGGIDQARHPFNHYDLDEHVQRAYELQSTMHISYSEIEAEFLKKRADFKESAQADFNNSILEGIPYHLVIAGRTKLIIFPNKNITEPTPVYSYYTKEIHIPKGNLTDWDKSAIESEIRRTIDDNLPEPRNVMTETLDYLKATSRIKNNATYDELRQILIDKQAMFCDKGKAQKLNRAIKKIFPNRIYAVTTSIP